MNSIDINSYLIKIYKQIKCFYQKFNYIIVCVHQQYLNKLNKNTSNKLCLQMVLLMFYCFLLVFINSSNFMRYDLSNGGLFTVVSTAESKRGLELFVKLSDQAGFTVLKRVMYNPNTVNKYTEIQITLLVGQLLVAVSRMNFDCVLIVNPAGNGGAGYFHLKKLDSLNTVLSAGNQDVSSLLTLGGLMGDFNAVQISTQCKAIRINSQIFHFSPLIPGWLYSYNIVSFRYAISHDFNYIVQQDIYQMVYYNQVTQVFSPITQITLNATQQTQLLDCTNIQIQCSQLNCYVLFYTPNNSNSGSNIKFNLFIYQKDRIQNFWVTKIYRDFYIGDISLSCSPKINNVLLQYYDFMTRITKSICLRLNTRPLVEFSSYPQLQTSYPGFNNIALSDNYLLIFCYLKENFDKLSQKIIRINGDYTAQLILWDPSYNTGFTNFFYIQENSYGQYQTALHYYIINETIRVVSQTKFISEALGLQSGQIIEINNNPSDQVFVSSLLQTQNKSSNILIIILSVSIPSVIIILITILFILRKKRIIKLPKCIRRWLKKSKVKNHIPKQKQLYKHQDGELKQNSFPSADISGIEKNRYKRPQNIMDIFIGASNHEFNSVRQMATAQGNEQINQTIQPPVIKKQKNYKKYIVPLKYTTRKLKRQQRAILNMSVISGQITQQQTHEKQDRE